jgi:hypothetical protein
MVSNPLKVKTHLNGERKKRNKWLRWLHMIKHREKIGEDPNPFVCNSIILKTFFSYPN